MIIKASFINSNDGEYDYFEIEHCKDITYTDSYLLSVNISLAVVYSTTYDKNKNKVIFTGKLEKRKSEIPHNENNVINDSANNLDVINIEVYENISYELEPQDFVDILSKVVVNRILLDADKDIQKIKEKIKQDFCTKLLEDNVLFYDTVYTTFGYICTQSDEMIGTFEKIKLFDKNKIKLDELLLLPEKSLDDNFKIKFRFKDKEYCYLLTTHDKKDENCFTISSFSFHALEFGDTKYEVEPFDSFKTYDDFMLNRRKLLINENYEDIFSNYDFNDLDF